MTPYVDMVTSIIDGVAEMAGLIQNTQQLVKECVANHLDRASQEVESECNLFRFCSLGILGLLVFAPKSVMHR